MPRKQGVIQLRDMLLKANGLASLHQNAILVQKWVKNSVTTRNGKPRHIAVNAAMDEPCQMPVNAAAGWRLCGWRPTLGWLLFRVLLG